MFELNGQDGKSHETVFVKPGAEQGRDARQGKMAVAGGYFSLEWDGDAEEAVTFPVLAVLVTANEDGNSRPSLAPVASAFGSGLVGVACYRTNNSWEDGFRRTGFSYSTYFVTAFFHEFQPELSSYASRLLHKHK